MSTSPPPIAGPSNGSGPARLDGALLRQFVEAYLQQHGFDKALEMFRQGFADGTEDKDADGEGEVETTGGRTRPSGGGGPSTQPGGREAIFRAPGPVALDSAMKRNIPQAQFISASTMSERITPEFEAQAKYIIDALVKKQDDAGGEDKPSTEKSEPLLDPSEMVEGYKRYMRWVDDGLDMWKVSSAEGFYGKMLTSSPSWMQCRIRSSRTPFSIS